MWCVLMKEGSEKREVRRGKRMMLEAAGSVEFNISGIKLMICKIKGNTFVFKSWKIPL